MGRPLINLIGLRFGTLTVRELGVSQGNGKRKRTFWLCECDCGNTLEVAAGALRKGQQNCRKCGTRRENMTGKKFGRLKVMKLGIPKGKTKKVTYWVCRCDCGVTLEVAASALRGGQQSCGKCISSIIDLTGQRYGRLEVIELDKTERDKKDRGAYWICKCDCGNLTSVGSSELKSGNTNSCGCLHNEITSNINRKHGMYLSSEYRTWIGMFSRCNNPHHKEFKNYGGRGIKVCERWTNSFESFFEDMGNRPKGMSLDRIDNNGPYCKENCHWATPIEQASNKRTNVFVTFEGKTLTLSSWSREKNINVRTLNGRYQRGVRGEELFMPFHRNKQRTVTTCPVAM